MRKRSELSARQQRVLLQLGELEASARIDPVVVSDLLRLGMLDVDPTDRQVVLTKTGRKVWKALQPSVK